MKKSKLNVAEATAMLETIIPQLDAIANYQDVEQILELSSTCASYTKLKEKSGTARNLAAQAYVRAERKLGEILSTMPAQRGVPGVEGKTKIYEELGINRMRASRAQKLATVDSDEFKNYVDTCLDEGVEPSVAGAINYAGEMGTIRASVSKVMEFKKTAAKDFKEVFELYDDLFDESLKKKHGYVIVTESRGVNIVPGAVPARIWKAAKFLMVLTQQNDIADFVKRMQPPGIELRWIISLETSSVRNENVKINSTWRPVLIFNGDGWIERDVIRGVRDHGEFSLRQQFERCILTYTNENDVVFDPFMRDSSCAVAAISTSRRFMGCIADGAKLNKKKLEDEIKECFRSAEF